MKYFYLLFIFHFFLFVKAQNKKEQTFHEVKSNVSATYFRDPLGTKDKALLLKKIAKTNEEIIISYQYLGYIYDLTGNVDSAKYYLTTRLDLVKKHFPKELHYYTAVIDYANWGMNYLDREIIISELIGALTKIDKAQFKDDAQFKKQKGLMLLLLGDVFLKDKDIEKAEFYLDKSHQLLEGKYVDTDYYSRKSDIEILRKNYSKAKDYMYLAINSFNDKEIFTYPLFLRSLGYIYLKENDYENAKQYLFESLHYQKKNNFFELTSRTYLYLYFLEKRSDKNTSTEKFYLDKALEYDDGDIELLQEIYLAYKDYFSRHDDAIKEKEFEDKYNEIKDSIFNKEKLKIKNDLESKYQFKESQKELALKEEIIKKEKSVQKAYALGLSLLGVLIVVILFFYFLRLKTQERLRNNQRLLHEEQLKLMLENQRTEIIKERIKAKIDERGKLSLELHDGIASEISALKLSLATESKLTRLEIDELVKKIDSVYTEIRNLSHDLDPDNIDFVEFSQFVANLCKQIEKSGLQTSKNLYITKRIDDLEVETLVNVYRIIQEIVTNVLKHANASEVVFDVVETDETLYIHIKDDGVGFDLGNTEQGIGLRNIKKRVQSFDGQFEIITKIGSGTEFKINLPIMKHLTPENSVLV